MKSINIDWTDGTNVAKAFNWIGTHNVLELDAFMREFWIYWGNETDEWQVNFVKSADPNVIAWIVNHHK